MSVSCCPIVSVSDWQCVRLSLCPFPTVSNYHCVRFLLCPIGNMSDCHCARFLLCSVNTVSDCNHRVSVSYCIRLSLCPIHSIYCVRFILYATGLYLYRIGKAESPLCLHCNPGREDIGEHTLLECAKLREVLHEKIGNDLSRRVRKKIIPSRRRDF